MIRHNYSILVISIACLAGILGVATNTATADPCGMVPPVYLQGNVPLERIGLQKTYVFYRNGVETFVIRPGFQGRVEEFGMLIPFPAPPALRKVPDETFAHIAAAIDPPEVVVDLTPELFEYDMMVPFASAGAMRGDDAPLELSTVNVLKQEAVGMYEVAVLEAGSADALNRWMTDHGYRYPEGMDGVCEDYVKDGWCFVAVKARVGQKDGVDPKPGMEATNSALPDGAAFDGHVQGMGFRFRSDELVVPMRLSAFNEGDLHNVVYLLTDKPMKARDLPAGHVVRQVSGAELLHNLTKPLPLRIIGGDYDDIPENRQQSLVVERDPTPHNGIAKILFAGDLSAAGTRELAHHHEELEKELLAIGERLNLRGPEIDGLHDETLQAERDEIAAAAIKEVESMTMTVIDGDFERDVIAVENVYFTGFEMNPARNTPRSYNARLFTASSEGAGELLDAAAAVPMVAVIHPQHGRLILQDSESGNDPRFWIILAGVLITVAFLCVLAVRRKRGTTVGLILLCLAVGNSMAQDEAGQRPVIETVSALLDEIHEGPDRAAAIGSVAALDADAVSELLNVAKSPGRIERRGWAVICLSEVNTEQSRQALHALLTDPSVPRLVQTWAAAAAVQKIQQIADLDQYVQLCNSFPAMRRPVGMKVIELLEQKDGNLSVESLLRVAAADYQLQQTLAPVLIKMKPEELVKVMLGSESQDIRQQAAAWLATQKGQNVPEVEAAVVKSITFEEAAQAVPWGDGPLYIPATNWQKTEAVALINELTVWALWCSANELSAEFSKIHTNLNSRQLMSAAGYNQVPGEVSQWLAVWQQVIGADAMETLTKRAGVRFKPAQFEKL